ncbi:MAG: transglutaminase-like domain-containing protein [Terrimicrobiaceae bacterium]
MPRTHRFSISTRLQYHLSQEGWLLLNMAATRCASQRIIWESVRNSLDIPFHSQAVPEGTSRFHGIAVPAGDLEISYDAEIERDIAGSRNHADMPESLLIDVPPEVVRFLYPSRYCESDKLVRLAAKEFGGFAPGHERVAGICNWIFSQIDYQFGITDAHTSAVDCLTLRAGVCRDFAHLGVAFCRAMGIPARYGSAYAYGLPQPDFHAFFEVWLGGRWWYYDATRLAPQEGFIWVGSGHDAADTSVATMSSSVEFVSMEIGVEQLSTHLVDYAMEPVGF